MIVEEQKDDYVKFDTELKLLKQALDLIKNEKDPNKILNFFKENNIVNENSGKRSVTELINDVKKLKSKIGPRYRHGRRIRHNYENIKVIIDYEKIESIMSQNFRLSDIRSAGRDSLKKYINYNELLDKVIYDINWYVKYISEGPKVLDQIHEFLSKTFEGVEPVGEPVFDTILVIKAAAELIIGLFSKSWGWVQSAINHYYGTALPYFIILKKELIEKTNIIWIISYIKYFENEIVNKEIKGIFRKIISDNLHDYVRSYTNAYKIASHKEYMERFGENRY